jgi:GAF domain-containing protein
MSERNLGAGDARPATRQALTSRGAPAGAGLARELSELARDLQSLPDEAQVQQHIVDAALREINGASAAGIMIVNRREVTTTAQTAPLVADVDRAQYEAGEGPCLTSLREEVTVRADDLSTDERWPRFAQAALALGVRAMLSFQLFVEGDNLGALNIYRTEPDGFDEQAESAGLLLASHAAVALADARVEHHLRMALESRDVIGQAKGILMERYRFGAQHAFEMLLVLSQHRHQKLRDLAEEIAATGEVPGA